MAQPKYLPSPDMRNYSLPPPTPHSNTEQFSFNVAAGQKLIFVDEPHFVDSSGRIGELRVEEKKWKALIVPFATAKFASSTHAETYSIVVTTDQPIDPPFFPQMFCANPEWVDHPKPDYVEFRVRPSRRVRGQNVPINKMPEGYVRVEIKRGKTTVETKLVTFRLLSRDRTKPTQVCVFLPVFNFSPFFRVRHTRNFEGNPMSRTDFPHCVHPWLFAQCTDH